ncbi:MAG: TPM domain-containing protein, partial [Arenimonas sp.]
MLQRMLLNLFSGWFGVWRWFPRPALARIAAAIAAGERTHSGEVCFAVESRYAPWNVAAGRNVAGRARDVFGRLRVWDTQDNSGVLLYLQLAERRVEIVADRGIAAHVAREQWQALCAQFADEMHAGEPEAA